MIFTSWATIHHTFLLIILKILSRYFGYENHVSTGFVWWVYERVQFRIRIIRQAVTCWALNSRCLTIFWNPHYAASPSAARAWRGIAYLSYAFESPFFLLTAKNFLLVFFLNVQVVRTEDLHFLQFLTIPALKVHNIIYLSFAWVEKVQLFDRLRLEDKRSSSTRSAHRH